MEEKKAKLNEAQEKFCVNVAGGKSLIDSYRDAYPKSAGWQRQTIYNKSGELSKKEQIVQRIDEIKQSLKEKVEKEFIWRQEDSIKILSDIARYEDKASDRISAIKELNSLLGLSAPKKLDHSSSDGSMTPQPVIDMSKLSDSALEEIMNAKITK